MDGIYNPSFEQNSENDRININENSNDHETTQKETKNSKYWNRFKNSENQPWISTIFHIILLIHFVWASLHFFNKFETIENCDFNWCNGYGMLLLLLLTIYTYLFYSILHKQCTDNGSIRFFTSIYKRIENMRKKCDCCSLSTVFVSAIMFGIAIFVIVDTFDSTERLISLSGILVLTAITWIFSKHRTRVIWRPVFTGFALQFLFGIIVIRWSTGRNALQCFSEKVASFLDSSQVANSFVYSSELVEKGIFAFTALPVIFFMSSVVRVLYYLQIMQKIVLRLGRILQNIMGTTICESIMSSANVFLGMTESPLLVLPYLNRLTISEWHAIMCSGFACVSGTVLAAYISFGAKPSHLIAASVMSAPASLCFAKLFYPETEKTLTNYEELKNIEHEKTDDMSFLDAASKGATAGIELIMGIIANLIAFLSFVTFFNSLLVWSCELCGYSDITIELVMSKIFMPLSWLMGVPWEQCGDVGTLIGLKTVINEFVAFQKLGELKKLGKLSARSEAIATYAICGFSNPGSVGIMIGTMTSLVPEKRHEITSVVVRAFISGSFVCFLTACVAGVLITEDSYTTNHVNSTFLNAVL